MFGNVLQVLRMLRFRDAPFQSERRPVAAFIITRIQTGDYDRWRPMFDQDRPRAREKAQVQRVLRSVDDPDEVFIYLEYESVVRAIEAVIAVLTDSAPR